VSNENWCGVPAIGHVSETGAVYVGNDRYIAGWVISGAPYTHREGKLTTRPNTRTIVDKDGGLYNYGLTLEEAEKKVNELNEMAALAMLLKGG
jgi:hypothetical protein